LADLNKRVEADAKAVAELGNAVAGSLGKLRAEREKETGRPTCP